MLSRLDVRMRNHRVVIRSTENDLIRPSVIHLAESLLRRLGVSHLVLQIHPDAIRRGRIRPTYGFRTNLVKVFDSSRDCDRLMDFANVLERPRPRIHHRG